MEKFGIFELLDTLSALTLSQTDEAEMQNDEREHSPAPVKASAAFAPPAFGIPQPLSDGKAAQDGNAFSALLNRHEKISKKIDGQK